MRYVLLVVWAAATYARHALCPRCSQAKYPGLIKVLILAKRVVHGADRRAVIARSQGLSTAGQVALPDVSAITKEIKRGGHPRD